ncbi:MAG: tRNA preQ1(34) S-adenosylmethionine ribosyltransferase-isomerase QueA [Actinomycetes bacterium]|jgi:S-adenosylmethionine:tRNA ribosyltransferase-isomerase
MRVSDFTYELPEDAIAQVPVEPRHSSRLLDTRDMSDHTFIELPDLLSPGDLVVVNETRVRHARVEGVRRETGARVELLFLDRRPDGRWEALARPARKLRPGTVVDLAEGSVTVAESLGEGRLVVEVAADDPEELIDRVGRVPLPPYIRATLDDPARYQTIFATTRGSAAAPTAGLHFTPEVVAGLRERGVDLATVDLHVSLDTFRPMSSERVEDHRMHSEWCSVPEETARAIAATRERGGRVVAIGTTVVRTLESRADGTGGVIPGGGWTDIFIRPGGHPITVVDLLVTNFHLPGSTLLVLVAAFMGDRWREAYETALERGYRFLSFGDAMLAGRKEPQP